MMLSGSNSYMPTWVEQEGVGAEWINCSWRQQSAWVARVVENNKYIKKNQKPKSIRLEDGLTLATLGSGPYLQLGRAGSGCRCRWHQAGVPNLELHGRRHKPPPKAKGWRLCICSSLWCFLQRVCSYFPWAPTHPLSCVLPISKRSRFMLETRKPCLTQTGITLSMAHTDWP